MRLADRLTDCRYDEWLVPRGYEPFRMELRFFSVELRLCGSIDALFRHRETGELIMVDWKRSRGIDRDGYTRVPRSEPSAEGELFEWRENENGVPWWSKRCTGILSERCSDKYTKYFAQQSVYRWALGYYADLKIARHYLLVCHPAQGDRYDLIPLEYDAELMEAYHADRRRRIVEQEAAEATEAAKVAAKAASAAVDDAVVVAADKEDAIEHYYETLD